MMSPTAKKKNITARWNKKRNWLQAPKFPVYLVPSHPTIIHFRTRLCKRSNPLKMSLVQVNAKSSIPLWKNKSSKWEQKHHQIWLIQKSTVTSNTWDLSWWPSVTKLDIYILIKCELCQIVESGTATKTLSNGSLHEGHQLQNSTKPSGIISSLTPLIHIYVMTASAWN